MAYYYTTGGHRHCSSGDMIILICHVILQDHVTRELFGFLCETLLWWS